MRLLRPTRSRESIVERKHESKSAHQSDRCKALVSPCVALGNELVDDDVEHRAWGEPESQRQYGARKLKGEDGSEGRWRLAGSRCRRDGGGRPARPSDVDEPDCGREPSGTLYSCAAFADCRAEGGTRY